MSLPALFLGRFQPFHLGHLDAIAQVLEKEDRVIIVIGSAEDDFTLENPLTAGERYELIEKSLNETGMSGRFSIVPIRNIHAYALWARHVERLLPQFGAVYTGSKIVRELFGQDGRHEILSIKIRKKISATATRNAIAKGTSLEKFVPKAAARLLLEWNIQQRLSMWNGNEHGSV